jgi:hypothetical protein
MADDQPEPPTVLPSEAVDVIDGLTESELRAVIEYARDRQEYLHTAAADKIEPGPGEEIVRVEERTGYTEVLKREPCGEECEDCPHGPYLYHVREELHPDGETQLHWHYIGPVEE